MLATLGRFIVVFGLVATLAAHWALLQSVAWTTMLANNLQSCSFHDAIAKTFDGIHPCCLCKAIAAAKKSQQQNQFILQQHKLQFPPLHEAFALIAPLRLDLFPAPKSPAKSFPQKPPTPPPRGSFV